MRVRFDRGTWLIEGAPPGVEPASLPGVLWDPRVGAYRAEYSQHEPGLRRKGGYRWDPWELT
jgi:hypothetical protein